MRLIDADALRLDLTESWTEALYAVKNAPTIDPVKHGIWENGYTLKMCSVCKGTVAFHTEYDYCPHCGARMEDK